MTVKGSLMADSVLSLTSLWLSDDCRLMLLILCEVPQSSTVGDAQQCYCRSATLFLDTEVPQESPGALLQHELHLFSPFAKKVGVRSSVLD